MRTLLLIFLAIIGSSACTYAGTTDFEFTVNTNATGASNTTMFTIPTNGSGYSYSVDWKNDGTQISTGQTGSATHDFITAGTYTIRISGTFPRIYFNGGGDAVKMVSIVQWGSAMN